MLWRHRYHKCCIVGGHCPVLARGHCVHVPVRPEVQVVLWSLATGVQLPPREAWQALPSKITEIHQGSTRISPTPPQRGGTSRTRGSAFLSVRVSCAPSASPVCGALLYSAFTSFFPCGNAGHTPGSSSRKLWSCFLRLTCQ